MAHPGQTPGPIWSLGRPGMASLVQPNLDPSPQHGMEPASSHLGDLVQGIVEIPCHTRNAAAAAAAFVCADLVLGGYENPVPLDETIDAVLAVGKMLPAELRCTARGGLATAPSARKLKRRK